MRARGRWRRTIKILVADPALELPEAAHAKLASWEMPADVSRAVGTPAVVSEADADVVVFGPSFVADATRIRQMTHVSLVFLSATELASLAERDSAGTPVVSLVTLALRLGTLDTPDGEA